MSVFRSRGGIASVEFAVILPFLIVTLFGMIEIGRVLYNYHAVTKSVRDATRYLTRVGITCPTAGASSGPLASYLDDAIQETIATNLAMTGTVDNPTGPADYLLSYWTDANTITTTVNCVANAGQFEGVYADQPYIPRITMNADVPFNFLWGMVVLDRNSVVMAISHNQVHVGG